MKHVLPLLSILLLTGCGEAGPKFSGGTLALLEQFQQNVGNKNSTTFESLCGKVETQHQAGQLTKEQYDTLKGVCDQVNDGRWEEAEQRINELVEASKSD